LNLASEVWYSVGTDTSAIMTASIANRADLHQWSYEIENQPSWLQVSAEAYDYEYELSFTTTGDVPVGAYDIPVKIKAVRDGVTIEGTSILKVFRDDGPALEFKGFEEGQMINVGDEGLTIRDVDGVKYLSFQFGLHNSGNRDLRYSIQSYNPGAVFETPAARIVQPGQTQNVVLTIPLVGIPIPREGEEGRFMVQFGVHSNAGEKSTYLRFNLRGLLDL
jgi:hypothetical protein